MIYDDDDDVTFNMLDNTPETASETALPEWIEIGQYDEDELDEYLKSYDY